jgi:hypothetical protein
MVVSTGSTTAVLSGTTLLHGFKVVPLSAEHTVKFAVGINNYELIAIKKRVTPVKA